VHPLDARHFNFNCAANTLIWHGHGFPCSHYFGAHTQNIGFRDAKTLMQRIITQYNPIQMPYNTRGPDRWSLKLKIDNFKLASSFLSLVPNFCKASEVLKLERPLLKSASGYIKPIYCSIVLFSADYHNPLNSNTG
jgi:hypothetical protein